MCFSSVISYHTAITRAQYNGRSTVKIRTRGSHDRLLIIKPVIKMADRKRLSSDEFSWDEKRKKCQITYSTFKKWQRQFNIEYQSLSWLRCDKDKNDKSVVSTLWCEVCRQYENKICSFKNFSNRGLKALETIEQATWLTTQQVASTVQR